MIKRIFKSPILLVITLVVAFLLVLSSLFVLSALTISKNQRELLVLELDSNANRLDKEFSKIEASILSVSSYIKSQSNTDELLSYLVSIDGQNSVISSIYFGMPDKTMINSSGFVPPLSFDLTTRDWYQKAIKDDSVVFTNAFINATKDRVIVTVALAVYDGDTLLGVIGADIDIRSVTSFIDNLSYSTGNYGFLFDQNNNLIAYPNIDESSLQLKSVSNYSIPVDELINNNAITGTVSINGTKGIIAYKKMINDTYTFGLFMPNSVLHQNEHLFQNIGLGLLVIVILVGSVIIIIYRFFINQPLNELILDIKKIDSSNNFKYRIPENKKSSFNDARSALNKLLNITEEYQTQAENSLKDLIFKNQELNVMLDSASDIVFRVDTSRRYVEVHGQGLVTIGKTEAEIIGKTFSEVIGQKSSPERDREFNRIFKGQKSLYTWVYKMENKLVYFETNMSPLYDINNKIIGAVGISRDITEQELRYERILYVSTHDFLTDLYNRKYYIEYLDKINDLEQYPFAIMNIDVNGLKIINDAYGHEIGDLVLKKVAEVLRKNCDKNHIASRVSGDEFTVILPNSDIEKAQELKEKLMKDFSQIMISNINLSVAIGYFVKKDNSIDMDEVRKRAENDMFRHKVSVRKSVKNKAISAILKTLTDKFESEKQHSKRVSEIAVSIGKALKLNDEDLADLQTAALFHDIGKISIPDAIINKPGKLTKEEFDIIKTHTEIGYQILRAADEYSDLAIYASSHHERWDGKGYPKGLKGEDIPYFSRIISIADSFEAMTADRPYREKQTNEFAISEIKKYAGTQFDPILARVYIEKVLNLNWEDI